MDKQLHPRADWGIKVADDDAGNLQSVFLKRLYLLRMCIFLFILFNTSLTIIYRYHDHLNHDFTVFGIVISFELEFFFTFLFSTRKRLIRFLFARCLVEWL